MRHRSCRIHERSSDNWRQRHKQQKSVKMDLTRWTNQIKDAVVVAWRRAAWRSKETYRNWTNMGDDVFCLAFSLILPYKAGHIEFEHMYSFVLSPRSFPRHKSVDRIVQKGNEDNCKGEDQSITFSLNSQKSNILINIFCSRLHR